MGLNIFKEKEELKAKLEAAENARTDAEAKLQAVRVEFERFKRHSRETQSGTDRRAKIDAAAEFLPVYDLLKLALNAPGADDSYRDGIRMTLDKFISTLKANDLILMECVGKPFDPNYHEAAEHTKSEGTESGIITEIIRDGFFSETEGIIVRHALVKVAK